MWPISPHWRYLLPYVDASLLDPVLGQVSSPCWTPCLGFPPHGCPCHLAWAPAHWAGLPLAPSSMWMAPVLSWVLIPPATPIMWASSILLYIGLPLCLNAFFTFSGSDTQAACSPQTSIYLFFSVIGLWHLTLASSSFWHLEGHLPCSATYGFLDWSVQDRERGGTGAVDTSLPKVFSAIPYFHPIPLEWGHPSRHLWWLLPWFLVLPNPSTCSCLALLSSFRITRGLYIVVIVEREKTEWRQ